jgi:Ser/Thr protein kinase RdoA (MazF antagonist)
MSQPTGTAHEEVVQALAAWSALEGAEVKSLAGGLINQSWRVVTSGREYVVQRVHEDFAAGIHANIQAISRHLESRGVVVARLLETDEGTLFSDRGVGGRWRVMEKLPGVSFGKCRSSAQAQSAGALVASFHRGLMDWSGELAPIGFPFHDLSRHLSDLRQALEDRAHHPLHSEVQKLAENLFAIEQAWPPHPALPLRVLHGDLKFSNLLFAGHEPPEGDRAHALIDLDTISRLPLYYDMGDAWRSWCNVGGEGPGDVRLDLEIFRASAEGYLSGLGMEISPDERASLADAVERVSLELCSRFAADALNESHFAWDRASFASAAEHNLYRARGQLALHHQARETRDERARFLLG